jgi:hypothetical protein
MKSEKPFILVYGLAKVGEFDTKEQAEQEKAKRTAIDAHFTFAHVREFQEGGEFVQA